MASKTAIVQAAAGNPGVGPLASGDTLVDGDGNAFASAASDALKAPLASPTFTGVATAPTFTATTGLNAKRIKTTGTALAITDYAVSAGWGTTPTKAITGTDMGGRITITAKATTAANPTVALTFKDGTFTTVPALAYGRGDAVAPTTCFWALTTITATVATWTFVGTPTANNVYVLDWVVLGQ